VPATLAYFPLIAASVLRLLTSTVKASHAHAVAAGVHQRY